MLRTTTLMSEKGQAEKNSLRAYVFRFALDLGHCSMQAACLKGARSRHWTQQGVADSATLQCEFHSTRRKASRVASDHRYVHGVGPAVRRIVEDLGAAHQRNVAGASAMNCAGFAARHRSGLCFVVDS